MPRTTTFFQALLEGSLQHRPSLLASKAMSPLTSSRSSGMQAEQGEAGSLVVQQPVMPPLAATATTSKNVKRNVVFESVGDRMVILASDNSRQFQTNDVAQ
jgi:hypothetical protein